MSNPQNPGQPWQTPITVAAKGVDTDISKQGFGLPPGLYVVKQEGQMILKPGEQGKSPLLEIPVVVVSSKGEGAAPPGATDVLRVTTEESEFGKRLRAAMALSFGYSEAEVTAVDTFQLLPARIAGQQAIVWSQQNGINPAGYPNVNRNFIARQHFEAKKVEIDKHGGKVPYGPLGQHGRKDGGAGAATAIPGLPMGAAPNFGTAPAPAFAQQPAQNGAPAPAFAPPPAAPNLDAMGTQQLKM